MRGRKLAQIFNPLFIITINFLRCTPMSLRIGGYSLIKNLRGKIGIGMRYIVLSSITKIGKNVSVHPNVYLLNPKNIEIGDNVSIHPFCYIESYGKIIIGNDVSIAHGVTLMSTTHNFDRIDMPIKDQGCTKKPIVIGNNVWIGAKATILGGTPRRIGDGSIIGAGAVVNKDIEANTINVGIPSKKIKTRG